MGINVLDWTGGPFLALYGVLYVLALLASWLIARALVPPGMVGVLADAEEVAVLGAGRDRLAEATVARLLERGALTVTRRQLMVVPGAPGQGLAERAVLALPAPLRWRAVRAAVDGVRGGVEQRLIRRGLMQPQADAVKQALLACLPLAALIVLGLAKAQVGAGRGHPVGYLMVFLLVTAATVLIRCMRARRATRAGLDALALVRAERGRLRLAPDRGAADMAVALFGTSVLAIGTMGEFHRMRVNGGGDSGSSSGDGGGDGGCGGGGCGGCGS